METTTEFLSTLLETTTTFTSAAASGAYSQLLSAADILSDSDSASASDDLSEGSVEHPDAHSQITFEIPSHSDLERIQTLDTFSTLLKRLGSTVYTSGIEHVSGVGVGAGSHGPIAIAADGQPITSEQISNSVVLNLADLKQPSGLERFFQGADMHSIINYLWIGVVTALVVLSVIFILFSCYFYRKFREWKKCNKDIRAHMNGNLPGDMYAGHGSGNAPCDNLLPRHPGSPEAAYYQMESPPCYTIATGLPTYDEALHHHQHFSFGMKFVCPGLAAVHHHPAISGRATSNWEKHDMAISRLQQQQQLTHDQQQLQLQRKDMVVKSSPVMPAAPPAYDAVAAAAAAASASAASQAVALLSGRVKEQRIEIEACEGAAAKEAASATEPPSASASATNDSDDNNGLVVVVA